MDYSVKCPVSGLCAVLPFAALLCLQPRLAPAASVGMPVTVILIRCGIEEPAPRSCEKDHRCCQFIEPAAGGEDMSGSGPALPYDKAEAHHGREIAFTTSPALLREFRHSLKPGP